jgi:hypothetical protein
MDHRDAFNFVVATFKLSMAELSRKSGVPQESITRFRKKQKDFVAETLFKLIGAMDRKHQAVFYGLMQNGQNGKNNEVEKDEVEKGGADE